jgi:hypothetical protein
MVDIDQEVDQSSKEEEYSGVEKGREGLNGTRETESLNALRVERSYAGPLVGCIPRPGRLQISANPLLHERCQERTRQAQHEAEEP